MASGDCQQDYMSIEIDIVSQEPKYYGSKQQTVEQLQHNIVVPAWCS